MTVPEIVIERVGIAVGEKTVDNIALGVPERIVETTGFRKRRVACDGTSLFDMMLDAAKKVESPLEGIVVASFTAPDRMPSLAVRLASALGLPSSAPAIDLTAACSAYPNALYVAGHLASDTGGKILLVDGDLQSPFVNESDESTASLFSDAATATLVSSDAASAERSSFAFLSRASDALVCPPDGPISMDGFKVFSFVAAEVVPWLKAFLESPEVSRESIDVFVPHQANMYMVRQIAKSLGLSDRLLTSGEHYANPGSCSVPLTIAHCGRSGRALLVGFGAGLSASAATVRIA